MYTSTYYVHRSTGEPYYKMYYSTVGRRWFIGLKTMCEDSGFWRSASLHSEQVPEADGDTFRDDPSWWTGTWYEDWRRYVYVDGDRQLREVRSRVGVIPRRVWRWGVVPRRASRAGLLN